MHHEFYHLAKNILNHPDRRFALATVFHVQGSAYRREGTRMAIEENGNWFGNISGGCLEGDILQKAKYVIESGENMLVTYDTRESINKEIRVALGCNGIIDILIEPVNSGIVEFCQTVSQLFEEENTAFLSTQIQLIKDKIQVTRDLTRNKPGDFPDDTFQNENFCKVDKGEFTISLKEYIGLQRKLVLWGSGPDVLPLSQFAKQLGWKIVVASDCNTERLEQQLTDIEVIHCNFDDFNLKTRVNENTAVLLVSHDFYKDYFILEKLIPQRVKYIGIMGPKRRGARMLDEWRKRHPEIVFDESQMHFPIGLDIGSDNPVEIALSIVAEIQSKFSGSNAAPLKEKKTGIHGQAAHGEPEYNPTDQVCTINYFQ